MLEHALVLAAFKETNCGLIFLCPPHRVVIVVDPARLR